MALLRVGSVSGTGTISANGAAAFNNTNNDGGGGGGAGGSVMVHAPNTVPLAGLTISADGGRGGDAWNTQAPGDVFPGERHGPGGGGGGGAVLTSSAPAAATVAGGASGFTTTAPLEKYGAIDGSPGTTATAALGQSPGVAAGAQCVPQLTVTKTTSTPSVLNGPGGTTATYTITVANAASQAAAVGADITDTLPAGFTFASTGAIGLSGGAVSTATVAPTAGSATPAWGTFSIPGGGQVQVTFTVDVAATVVPGTYNNSAAATYIDPKRTTPTGTTSATFGPGAPVTVSRAIDLEVTKTDNQATAVAGAPISYTIVVTNHGPNDVAGATITDTLPATLTGAVWTCVASPGSSCAAGSGTGGVSTTVDLLTGGTATFTLGATLDPSATVSLSNTATIAVPAGFTDTTPANNSAVDTDQVLVVDLALAKALNGQLTAGSNATYTLTVANVGTGASFAPTTVDDTLPAGLTFVSGGNSTWACAAAGQAVSCQTVAPIAPGASSSFPIVVRVASGATGVITNLGTVTTTGDMNSANNSATSGASVVQPPPPATPTTPATGQQIAGHLGLPAGMVFGGLALLLARGPTSRPRRRAPGRP